MKKIRIFIADDHPVVRKGIKAIVSEHPGFVVVGEADDGVRALEGITETAPDLIIMDITMPTLDGIEATRKILEKSPEIRVIIMSMHQNQHYAIEALRAGARGFVVKGSDSMHLIDAIEKVMSGNRYASPQLEEALFNEYVDMLKKNRPVEPAYPVTAREREVLTLVVDGLTNKEIGKRLFIADSTVKSHRIRLMEKMGVKDTAGLIRVAITTGLVKPT